MPSNWRAVRPDITEFGASHVLTEKRNDRSAMPCYMRVRANRSLTLPEMNQRSCAT